MTEISIGMFMFGGMMLAASIGIVLKDSSEIKADAIERGYAIHCPQDGRFAWVGECEQ